MKVKLSERIKAEEMYNELLECKQSVILIPAPDPRHATHMIRVAEMRPPEWFSEFIKRYPRTQPKKYPKTRSKINRRHVIQALKQIKTGQLKSQNSVRLYRYIKELIENELEQIPF